MAGASRSLLTRLQGAIQGASVALQQQARAATGGERNTVEKVWKLIDRVVKLCQQPAVDLKNSPPYIIEILPDMYEHLRLIQSNYSTPERAQTLNNIPFFVLFIDNIIDKCKQCMKLFRERGDEMFDPESSSRHILTRHALVLSHMLAELKALFPAGVYAGDTYLVTKGDAAAWWKKTFPNQAIVPWKQFKRSLSQVHRISSSLEATALKSIIDLTCNNHISCFEFDIFTRLFQPWSTLLVNWNVLAVTHPAFMAFLTYDEVKSRLAAHTDRPGSYVYRLSCTRLGQWAIGYVTSDGDVHQTIPHQTSLGEALIEGHREGYYLYPDGCSVNRDLRAALSDALAPEHRRLAVTEEQYAEYAEIGSTFELCKICAENNKEVRLEPCGHLLCAPCVQEWQGSRGQGCPFCRAEIRSMVSVTVDPFSREVKDQKGRGSTSSTESSGQEPASEASGSRDWLPSKPERPKPPAVESLRNQARSGEPTRNHRDESRHTQAPSNESARNQTPSAESTRNQTPPVESRNQTSSIESASNQTPSIESTCNQTSSNESARNQAPSNESARMKTPSAELRSSNDAARMKAVRCDVSGPGEESLYKAPRPMRGAEPAGGEAMNTATRLDNASTDYDVPSSSRFVRVARSPGGAPSVGARSPGGAPPLAGGRPSLAGRAEVSQGALLQLTIAEGFEEEAARRALAVARNDVTLARDILQQFSA